MNHKFFFYQKRYVSIAEKIQIKTVFFKQWLLRKLNNKFFKKRLNVIDQFYEKQERSEGKRIFGQYYRDSLRGHNQPKNFRNLSLPFISFFEVIEIEKFDSFQKIILKKFSSKHSSFFRDIKFKEELSQTLSDVKDDLNTSSFGKLINLDFSKLNLRDSDLIDRVQISYIKTRESYFILHLEITPSTRFNDIVSQICNSDETGISIKHFHSIKHILKHRIFNSHTSFENNLTRLNLKKIVSDLKHQVHNNILKHFKGYFSNSNIPYPEIQHYTLKGFLDSKNLHHVDLLFPNHLEKFSSNDQLVDIYLENENNRIYIIKEQGHGKRENQGNDISDYDFIESNFLIQSLVFTCVFSSVLRNEFLKLNKVKRKMYDFLEKTSQWNIFKYFLTLHYNNSYIDLKKQITKLALIISRYQNEIDEKTLDFFTNHADLTNYTRLKRYNDETDIHLKNFYSNNFKSQIKELEQKKETLTKVFKGIEELNAYRTNLLIQIVSLFIAILAFIFAFDKVKSFFVNLI